MVASHRAPLGPLGPWGPMPGYPAPMATLTVAVSAFACPWGPAAPLARPGALRMPVAVSPPPGALGRGCIGVARWLVLVCGLARGLGRGGAGGGGWVWGAGWRGVRLAGVRVVGENPVCRRGGVLGG